MNSPLTQIHNNIIITRMYKQSFWHRIGSKLLFPLAGIFFTIGLRFHEAESFCIILSIFLALFSFTIFNHKEFAFDKKRKLYSRFVSILGNKPTNWQALPPISKIVVKRFGEAPVADRRSWQVNNVLNSYIVMLSLTGESKGIIIHKFDEWQLAQALQLGKELAEYFEVEFITFGITESILSTGASLAQRNS